MLQSNKMLQRNSCIISVAGVALPRCISELSLPACNLYSKSIDNFYYLLLYRLRLLHLTYNCNTLQKRLVHRTDCITMRYVVTCRNCVLSKQPIKSLNLTWMKRKMSFSVELHSLKIFIHRLKGHEAYLKKYIYYGWKRSIIPTKLDPTWSQSHQWRRLLQIPFQSWDLLWTLDIW